MSEHRPTSELSRSVQACVERRAGRPDRFPAPLIALMLVSYVESASFADEPWSAEWFEAFFRGWLPSRAMFPEELAPHVVDVVSDIVEELADEGRVPFLHRDVIRADEQRWCRELCEAMRRARGHLSG